jgi:hypothetical protein
LSGLRRRVGNAATIDSLPASRATPMPMTGQNDPVKTAVMPVMLKPPDTVASARAAANVPVASPVDPGF